MTEAVIGLDTSNYRTSLAVVSISGEVLLDLRKLLPVPTGGRGLRQCDAVYAHLKSIKEFWPHVRKIANTCSFKAICASVKPRDHEDSYMPVFEVGDTVGRGMSATMDLPFFQTDHQHGHLRAARYGTCMEEDSCYLALHLSGGTTDLLWVCDEHIEQIGGSMDLHVGQLVDRIGVALGLSFPSGPALEELAKKGKSRGILGSSMGKGDLFCHFSGAETKGLDLIRRDSLSREDLAMEVYDLISRTTVRMLSAGKKTTDCGKCLICGGVASSGLFRKLLAEKIKKTRSELDIVFGEPAYSGDNAVGVALIGADRIRRQKNGGEIT